MSLPGLPSFPSGSKQYPCEHNSVKVKPCKEYWLYLFKKSSQAYVVSSSENNGFNPSFSHKKQSKTQKDFLKHLQ